MGDLTKDVNDHAGAESGLNAGLAADKRDAERYRWLRNRFCNDWGGPYFELLEGKGCYELKRGEELDEAIDAAMKPPRECCSHSDNGMCEQCCAEEWKRSDG